MALQIDQWKLKKHKRLTKAVIKRLPKSQFNSNGVAAKQATRLKILEDEAGTLHRTWESLDNSRLSSACSFERARLQIFTAGIVLPLLKRTKLNFFHVTIADKRWRVEPSKASQSCFDRPRRKVKAALEKLRREGYAPIYVAAYELSGNSSLSEPYFFEPHVHLILAGAPIKEMRCAFEVRLPRAAKGRDKPLKISAIESCELGNLLGYLTKIKAQDRVEYSLPDERTSRTPNDMRGVPATQWLRCMATMRITKLIQFGGFNEPLTSHFTHLEMASIIGELK